MIAFYIYVILWVIGFLYLATLEEEVLEHPGVDGLIPDWVNEQLLFYIAVIIGNMLLMGMLIMLQTFFKYIKTEISIWLAIRTVKKILKKHKIKL